MDEHIYIIDPDAFRTGFECGILRQNKDSLYQTRKLEDFLHSCCHFFYRVATAQGKQGKQGIWFLLFPDRENTGNFALTQGKILKHRENIFL